jgi:pimeloyl-ACP methyl ester carboxylesterase
VQAQFLAARREAFRTIGIDGLVHELLVLNRDWGFDLDDVVVPVRWWHGELDALTPGDLLRDVVGGRAGFRLTIYPGEGHTVGLTHTAEILAELALA